MQASLRDTTKTQLARKKVKSGLQASAYRHTRINSKRCRQKPAYPATSSTDSLALVLGIVRGFSESPVAVRGAFDKGDALGA
jgi:hypothetical protein